MFGKFEQEQTEDQSQLNEASLKEQSQGLGMNNFLQSANPVSKQEGEEPSGELHAPEREQGGGDGDANEGGNPNSGNDGGDADPEAEDEAWHWLRQELRLTDYQIVQQDEDQSLAQGNILSQLSQTQAWVEGQALLRRENDKLVEVQLPQATYYQQFDGVRLVAQGLRYDTSAEVLYFLTGIIQIPKLSSGLKVEISKGYYQAEKGLQFSHMEGDVTEQQAQELEMPVGTKQIQLEQLSDGRISISPQGVQPALEGGAASPSEKELPTPVAEPVNTAEENSTIEEAQTELKAEEEALETAEPTLTEVSPPTPTPKLPAKAEEDPDFQEVQSAIQTEAKQQKTHETTAEKVKQSHRSAIAPNNDISSQAKAKQVGIMNEQPAGSFNAKSFKERLMQQINNVLPRTEEAAYSFLESGKMSGVKQTVQNQVHTEQEQAAGKISSSAKTPPNEKGLTAKPSTPLPHVQELKAKPLDAKKAVPKPLDKTVVEEPITQDQEKLEEQFKQHELSEDQLEKSQEPSFLAALDQKRQAKEHGQQSIETYRQGETQRLQQVGKDNQNATDKELENMQTGRKDQLSSVKTDQQATAGQDSAARKTIAEKLEAIYEETKQKVEAKLKTLSDTVGQMFDQAAAEARKRMEGYISIQLEAYKKRRYSAEDAMWGTRWIVGSSRYVYDSAAGLPEEVNVIFVKGRDLYIEYMDQALSSIAEYVASELNATKNLIAQGKEKVTTYLKELPSKLRPLGESLAKSINAKFTSLENKVAEYENNLINNLTQRYTEALKVANERIEAIKAANKGFIDQAWQAIEGVAQTIKALKELLNKVLTTASKAIAAVLADPIGFFGNLASGVGSGFGNFVNNIGTHLETGFVNWLTGAASSLNIQIPENAFSAKGMLDIAAQTLGLTWEYLRSKAVAELGEKQVKKLEKGYEWFKIVQKDGLAGLWEQLKGQLSNIVETMKAEMLSLLTEEVIKAGVKLVMKLLTPAGAFISAVESIIALAKFIVEEGAKVLELVNSFMEAINAIAEGKVAVVAQLIEQALVKAVPTVINFLASFLGLNNLVDRIRGILQSIRAQVDLGVDWLLTQAKEWLSDPTGKKREAKKAKEAKEKEAQAAKDRAAAKKAARRNPAQQKKDFDKGLQEAQNLVQAPNQTTAEIHQGLQLIQAKYFLDELQGLLVKEEAETHTWLIKAKLGQYEVNQKVERQPSKATKEAEVNDADRAKHEAMAKEIEAKLKAITAQDGEVFADFYTRIKTEAAKLQTLYQPQLREGIVLSIELINSVKEDEKDGDVDVRVRIRPNETKARFNILFTDENVDDVLDHIRKVDTSVARKKGIGGCHNLEEWNKLRQASASAPIPVGKLITDSSVPEVLIISNTAHPSVPGVSIVQYAVPAIDGKVSDPTGNTIGKTTGAIKIIPNPKTLYDPLLWTDEALRNALMEAVVSQMDADNQLPLGNPLIGTTSAGYQIAFFLRSGFISTFWFA